MEFDLRIVKFETNGSRVINLALVKSPQKRNFFSFSRFRCLSSSKARKLEFFNGFSQKCIKSSPKSWRLFFGTRSLVQYFNFSSGAKAFHFFLSENVSGLLYFLKKVVFRLLLCSRPRARACQSNSR